MLEVQSSSLVKIISTRDVSATGRMSFGCPTDNYHYGILARKSGQGGFFLFRASRYKVDLIKSDIQPPSPDNEITACEGSMAVAAIKTSQGLELRRFLYTMSEREMKSDASIWKTGITSVAGVPLGQMLRLQMYSGTLYFMMDAGASKTGIFQISPDGNQTRWPDPPENPSNFFVTGAHSALVSTGSMIDGKAKLYLLGPKASYEPPSGNLTLSPNPGEAGKPAKLCWTTSGDVDSAVLQGYGPVDPKGGCMTVTPTTDTVYVLDLVGPAGTARAEARFVAVDPIAAYVPHDIKLYRYEANDPLNTISARMQMSLSFTNAASSFGQFGDAGTNFFRKLGSVSVSFCGADAILLRNSGNGWVDLVTPMEVAGKEQCDVVVSLDSPYGPAMSEPVKVNVVEENFAPFTNLVRLAADGTLDPASKLPYITKTITLSDGSRALAHIGPPEWSTPQTPLVAAQPGDELAAWGSGCGPAMITLGNEFTPDGATLQNPPQATLGGVGLETSGDFVYGFVGLCKVVFTVPAYFETEPKKPLQFNGKGEFTIPVEAAAGDGQ
ncbi:MAG: hypothetical protein M1383_01705 [Patescibacteria group bacterium]|nr:hypothetical protein [Patescibacteria group bacterium]